MYFTLLKFKPFIGLPFDIKLCKFFIYRIITSGDLFNM